MLLAVTDDLADRIFDPLNSQQLLQGDRRIVGVFGSLLIKVMLLLFDLAHRQHFGLSEDLVVFLHSLEQDLEKAEYGVVVKHAQNDEFDDAFLDRRIRPQNGDGDLELVQWEKINRTVFLLQSIAALLHWLLVLEIDRVRVCAETFVLLFLRLVTGLLWLGLD